MSKKRRDDRVHPFRWGGGFVSVVEIPPVQAYDCEAEDELDEAEDGLEKSDEGVPGWGGVGGERHVGVAVEADVFGVDCAGVGRVLLGLVLFGFFDADAEELEDEEPH
ncbi:hypothetical protein ACP6JC_002919 [Aspergillus fumigatus]